MKRVPLIVCLLLSFLFVLILLPDQKTEAQDTVPAGWTGIYDRAGLERISANPSGKYILMNDIDLSSAAWKPLCSEDEPFSGIFDGNGHTVYGMTASVSVRACGFFSYIFGGTVQSLTVSGSSSGPIAGMIAGRISRGTVKDCTVSGKVTSSYFGGGILGQVCGTAVTVSGCVSKVTVSGTGTGVTNPDGTAGYTDLMLGGLCGSVYGTGAVFSNCEFSGSLVPNGPVVAAGGIAGAAVGATTFADCVTKGTLSLTFTQRAEVGGIAGRAGSATASFLRCSFSADWAANECSGTLFLGGICGRIAAAAPVTVSKCSVSGSLTGKGHGNFLKNADGSDYECITCDALLSSAPISSYVGGVAGQSLACGSTVTVSECASFVTLTAKGGAVALGGIVGSNRAESGNAVVQNCYCAGKITYNTSVWGDLVSPIGGIAGINGGKATAQISKCVSFCTMDVAYPMADGAVVGLSRGDAGATATVTVSQCYYRAGEREYFATPLSGAQLSSAYAYGGLDFNTVWKTDPLSGIPLLRISDGLSSCPKGDVDGDGKITRYDGTVLTQYLTGNTTLSAAQIKRADLSGDGVLNSRDVTLILRSVQ